MLEVSSHGLSQRRADDVLFDVGIFTNLTRDHLDYHGGMEDYFEAKQRLFELLAAQGKATRAAVVNCDDAYGKLLMGECVKLGLRLLSYGFDTTAHLAIADFVQDFNGSSFVIRLQGAEYRVQTGFIGRHNAYNLTAAFGALLSLGYEPGRIAEHMRELPPVPGRLEPVGSAKIGVYVDYAHTPDALENVLKGLRELVRGKLWVVFGCGGDRDRGKRPEMARIARLLADRVIVTSDNPRTEDPQAIIAEILSGGIQADLVEVDRRTAIERTLLQAGEGDVVLIAGKGHENYQIIGTTKHHFSDQEEVRRVLRARSDLL